MILKKSKCIDCSEKDPIVLEFDHIVPEDKCDNISNLISTGSKLSRLKEEISKCDIVCANCHRKRTAAQQKWYILEFLKPPVA